jgi:NAD(P)-dependent dehydrogenase (short-subunit alcohol dehydrogenase family)
MGSAERTLVVTGVGSGIGRATALRLAADGATVYGVDVKGAKETAEAPEASGRIVGVEMDATEAEAWKSLVADVLAERGRIDSLVLVHGVTARQLDTVTDQTEEEWDFVLDVNLKACWLGMRAVLPSMLANGGGSVVCTTSGAALGGINGLAAYSASKGGLISLIRQAATDYAPAGVRINGVAPGIIQTPMLAAIPQEFADSIVKQTPLGRLGTPKDVAGVIAFLCSEDAAFLTGKIIEVDGGLVTQVVCGAL